MKQQSSIEVTVYPDGSLRIDAMGYQGSSCEAATAFLEEALGMVETRSRKREFYSVSTSAKTRNQNQQQIGGGDDSES